MKNHAKCHKTNSKKTGALKSFLAYRTIVFDKGHLNLTKKNICILSAQAEVTKAEVLDALFFVRANHSFASTNGNAESYCLIFGERKPVASAYRICETKVVYVIKFGNAQCVCRKLIKDVADTSFSFLFDETINSQVKKQ